jgi:tetratricopeptide (TPR) repeat protein
MQSTMRGRLGETLLSDLLREIARRKSNGLLRFTQERTIKAIFCEAGAPVFAISNLPNERIENKLIQDRLATPGLIETARQRNDGAQRLEQSLIDIGVCSEPVMQMAVRELAALIIESLFEWDHGEYLFEENVSAEHFAKLEWPATDCILLGMRHAAHIEDIATLIVPRYKQVAPVSDVEARPAHAASLTPAEGYLLSCIQSPTPISEVNALTGLTEAEARRALCVLLSLGALQLVDGNPNPQRETAREKPATSYPARPSLPRPVSVVEPARPVARPLSPPLATGNAIEATQKPAVLQADSAASTAPAATTKVADDKPSADTASRKAALPSPKTATPKTATTPATKVSTDNDVQYARWVMDEVTRKVNQFETADYYDVLGVDRLATGTTIRQAHADIEMMFNSFRARWPAHQDLDTKINALFAKVNEAYFTLSDLGKRRTYDMSLRKQATIATPVIERGQSETTRGSSSMASGITQSQAQLPPQGVPISNRPSLPVTDQKKLASAKFLQGRSHYEKRDFHTAAHLLREAVKLDDTRAEHHYLLAVVLSVLSQARHTHDAHEGCHVTCNLGGTLIRNQRVRYEAVQHFSEAARLEPANAEIRIKLGLLYKEAGMPKKAELAFWEALMLDGKNPVAMEELGLDGQTEVAKKDNPLAQKPAQKQTRKKRPAPR